MSIQQTITDLAHLAVTDDASCQRLSRVLRGQFNEGHIRPIERAMQAMPASPGRRLLTRLAEQFAASQTWTTASGEQTAHLIALGISLPGQAQHLDHALQQYRFTNRLSRQLVGGQAVIASQLLAFDDADRLDYPAVWRLTRKMAAAALQQETLFTQAEAVDLTASPRRIALALIMTEAGDAAVEPQIAGLRTMLHEACGDYRFVDIGQPALFFDALRQERHRAIGLAVMDELAQILYQHPLDPAQLAIIVYEQEPQEIRISVVYRPTGTHLAGIRRSLPSHVNALAVCQATADVFRQADFGSVRVALPQPADTPFLTLTDLQPLPQK